MATVTIYVAKEDLALVKRAKTELKKRGTSMSKVFSQYLRKTLGYEDADTQPQDSRMLTHKMLDI